MLDIKTFGEKLRKHRKNLNLTQEQVAEIKRNYTVSEYEKYYE